MERKVKVAPASFFLGQRFVHAGERFYEDDPIVVRAGSMFQDVDDVISSTVPVRAQEPMVEQATAAPGEKRPVRRPVQLARPISKSKGVNGNA